MRCLPTAALVLAAMVWVTTVAAHSQGDNSVAVSQQSVSPPENAGSTIFRARCLACHGPELVDQQRLSRAGWAREVEKMIAWGAPVLEQERAFLLDYLTARAGAVGARSSDGHGHPGALLVATRCLTCHGEDLIAQQRLTAAGWSREVDKMIDWGASVAGPEKMALVDYLTLTWGAVRRP